MVREQIEIKKMVGIKNYEAGTNGNMLVFTVDKINVTRETAKGKKVTCPLLMAACDIIDEAAIDKFDEMTDLETPADTVIVVSSKFLKMSNKKQLAMLAYENALVAGLAKDELVEEAIIDARVEVIERMGAIRGGLLLNKKDKGIKKAAKKASKGWHRAFKKETKADKKAAKKASKNSSNVDPDIDFEDVEEEINNASQQATSQQTSGAGATA